MKSLGAAVSLLLLAGVAACSAGHPGGGANGTVLPVVTFTLPVVTFTPPPGKPFAIPATLIEASPFRLTASVHSGFACFTMDGTPVAWPAGYSAVKGTGGRLEVRENGGRLLRTGGTQLLDVFTVQSAGDACSRKGQDMTVVWSLPKSA